MTDNSLKMYVVVREDMSHGYQIVQSCHAVADHERRYPKEGHIHGATSNTMVVLSVPNESTLLNLRAVFRDIETPFTLFWEPDVGQYTAMAISPSEHHGLLADLPLAGAKRKRWWSLR